MVIKDREQPVPVHPIPYTSFPTPKKWPTKTVTIFGPNAGGVKKTKTTLVIASVMKASGRDVLFICGDPGTGSLNESLQVGGPHHVDFFPRGEDPKYAEALVERLSELNLDHAFIDLGANVMLDAATSRTMLKALRDLRALGHETYVVISLDSGKGGLDGDAGNFARQFANTADVRLAFHGNTRHLEAGKFFQLTAIYPSFDVPNDDLAVLRLINDARVTPFDWCQSAPVDFQMAAGLMAKNLIELANQPDILPMIDAQAVSQCLKPIAAQRPQIRYKTLEQRWQVCDDVLRENQDEILALQRLRSQSEEDSDASLAETTRDYLRAYNHAQAAKRQAEKKFPA
ncbi:MAG: hypothetical protein ACXIT4_00490 [Erythrobacter sp.]